MTAKSFVYNNRGEAEKIPGWFSWRHRTNEAHEAARSRYLESHGPEARRRRAQERADSLRIVAVKGAAA